MAKIPDGWTDDLSIHVCPPRTLEEVVDIILAAMKSSRDYDETVAQLMADFRLSERDALLAIDRVGGGVTRAGTGALDNCPSRRKDPVAYIAFHKFFKKKKKRKNKK